MSLRWSALLVAGSLLVACGPEDEETPAECPADRIDPVPGGSIARRWDEQALDAIRRDTPNPGVHARNLFHLSGAMWDTWVAYQGDGAGRGYLVDERQTAEDVAAARDEAISQAAFTLLTHRYRKATGGDVSEACFRSLLDRLGYDPDSKSAPARFGRRVAESWIEAGLDDGANERGSYADTTGFVSINPPLDITVPGTVMVDPGVWQPLQLETAITQNGQQSSNLQRYIGAQWGNVRPFAMVRPAGGGLYHDPGPFPAFGTELHPAVAEVVRLSSQMADDETIDISPAAVGNNTLGSNDGAGYPENPATGARYAEQLVRRGDFGRVVAEFWADGPRSETPPGHWNVLANEVADHPGFERRFGGTGASLDRLEWDVKTYFALNGALHDAAITAWEIKRASLGVRPISLIRYMGGKGQSSDPNQPSYDPEGLPLVPGLSEVVTSETAGGRHAGLPVGSIAVRSWRSWGGVGWIRAVEWMPYQLRTFVTPSFPGFISGHSTFSRAAAEVLTSITGSPFFPGGLAEFVAAQNAYLRFERGPSTDVRLQWATYYDAADQAGRSRLWGGIHIEPDDFVGRRLGSEVGHDAWAFAQHYFETAE